MNLIIKTTMATGFLLSASLVQANTVAALSDEIRQQDARLFSAFNNCEPQKWRRYLAKDIEFYQDNDDPTYSRSELEPAFLDRCKEGQSASLIREFVPEGHEVHPIQGVGAVQFGTHRFLLKQADGSMSEVARPRFVHLWKKEQGQWRIIRVISYDH